MANKTNHPRGERKQEPTPRQKAAALILTANPDMPLGEALVLAGYSPAVKKNPNAIINSKGINSIKEAYSYEINSRIKPNLPAKRMKEGLKSKDLKVALEFIKEYKKDVGLSSDTIANAIQINLSPELKDLAG